MTDNQVDLIQLDEYSNVKKIKNQKNVQFFNPLKFVTTKSKSINSNLEKEEESQSYLHEKSEVGFIQEDRQEIYNSGSQELTEKYWENQIQKILFIPPDENYYDSKDISVKPGFGLFIALASAKSGFRQLEVNIPETHMIFESREIVFLTDQSGIVNRLFDIKWAEFEQLCFNQHKQFCQRFQNQNKDSRKRKFNERISYEVLFEKFDPEKNPECPLMIQRGLSSLDWKLSQNVIQVKDLELKYKSDASNTLLEQRFIFPKPLKAQVIRLVYNSKFTKDYPATHAYKLTNLIDIFDTHPKTNINFRACINTERQFSFQISKYNGIILKEYERQALSFIKFLEKNNSVCVKQIVLDFILDLEDKVWLIGMKSIRAESRVALGKIISSNDTSNTVQKKQFCETERNLDQIMGIGSCKLCGGILKKNSLNKILNYQLIRDILQHLKKRNITLNNINFYSKSKQQCIVCNLCYMLIVADEELMNVEKEFAKLQNIPIICTKNLPNLELRNQRPAFLKDRLNQWRLLFFIREITNIGLDQKIDFSNLYLHLKLEFKCFTFKINFFEKVDRRQKLVKSSMVLSDNQWSHFYKLNITQIRLYYFFSEQIDIKNFLNNTNVCFRLTEGPDWNSVVAEGSSKNIHRFKNMEKRGQLHSSQIYLFLKNAKYCVLKLQTGLVCDGEYCTSDLNLLKLKEIYFPDDTYYNSNDFPDEWMEMFNHDFYVRRQDMKEQNLEEYSIKCSRNELKKILD